MERLDDFLDLDGNPSIDCCPSQPCPSQPSSTRDTPSSVQNVTVATRKCSRSLQWLSQTSVVIPPIYKVTAPYMAAGFALSVHANAQGRWKDSAPMQVCLHCAAVRNMFELNTECGGSQAYYPLYVEPSGDVGEVEMDAPRDPGGAPHSGGTAETPTSTAAVKYRTITSGDAIRRLVKESYTSLATTNTKFKVPVSYCCSIDIFLLKSTCASFICISFSFRVANSSVHSLKCLFHQHSRTRET